MMLTLKRPFQTAKKNPVLARRLAEDDLPTLNLMFFLTTIAASKGHDVTAIETWIDDQIDAFGELRENFDANRSELEALYDEADTHIDTLMGLLGDLPKSIWSMVINWHDRDPEQGTFGHSCQAFNSEHAELLTRMEMERSDSGENHHEFSGTIVDKQEGATWEAKNLEVALRNLVAGIDGKDAAVYDAALTEARGVIARLDKF
ncbi:MAG: hypothetical protein K2X45_07950 [Phreatobacter sp.]|nr:hypothetical protein [Phreatobacter sp.]